jgi:hypothetical protein
LRSALFKEYPVAYGWNGAANVTTMRRFRGDGTRFESKDYICEDETRVVIAIAVSQQAGAKLESFIADGIAWHRIRAAGAMRIRIADGIESPKNRTARRVAILPTPPEGDVRRESQQRGWCHAESTPAAVSRFFPGPQALSMPQSLTNGCRRGENVAILQHGPAIERGERRERADPDCAAGAHA